MIPACVDSANIASSEIPKQFAPPAHSGLLAAHTQGLIVSRGEHVQVCMKIAGKSTKAVTTPRMLKRVYVDKPFYLCNFIS
jgi:hypothetical protein